MGRILTDDEVRREIERLSNDDDVRLARAEIRVRYRERQRLYALRNLKKRGVALREQGMSIEDYHVRSDELDDDMESQVDRPEYYDEA